ncbi:hypothetical protein ACJX0J_022471, partial [Zea mays]
VISTTLRFVLFIEIYIKTNINAGCGAVGGAGGAPEVGPADACGFAWISMVFMKNANLSAVQSQHNINYEGEIGFITQKILTSISNSPLITNQVINYFGKGKKLGEYQVAGVNV